MSTAKDNAASAPLFLEIRPGMRKALADAVEAFVALLDQFDADADLEDDDPPEDDAPCEDVGDDEPSLGATGTFFFPDQRHWAQGTDDDREDESEHASPAATKSRRSARRRQSISSTPGGRMRTPGARATKLSLRSAGRATATAIPRWRCAAMPTIGRGLPGRGTRKAMNTTAANRRNIGDDRPFQRHHPPALGPHLAHSPRALGNARLPGLRRLGRTAHARGFAHAALSAYILPSGGIRPRRRQERPDRGCNGGAFPIHGTASNSKRICRLSSPGDPPPSKRGRAR